MFLFYAYFLKKLLVPLVLVGEEQDAKGHAEEDGMTEPAKQAESKELVRPRASQNLQILVYILDMLVTHDCEAN